MGRVVKSVGRELGTLRARARGTAVVVVFGVGGWACGDSVTKGEALFSASDNVERVESSVVFDTLWAVGGPEDTILALPSLPRPDGAGGLVFFDLTNVKAYRIGADGDLLWSWGEKGEGPGEIMNVRALDVRSDGSVVLVDSGNQRLVTLDAKGRLVGEAPFRAGNSGAVQSLVALPDGRLVLHATRRVWGLWDSGGFVDVEVPANLGEPQILHHYGRGARWAGGRWVFGFGFGNGWMVFEGTRLLKVRPYVLHTDFPEVRFMRQGFTRHLQHTSRPVESGLSVSVRGDTLFVLFGGPERELWGRRLDRYDLRTGNYIATEVLPHWATRGVVGQSGRLFTVNSSALFPSIVALERVAPF